MRVLMLTHSYPPVPGGIEQHVRNLSAALVRRGHEVSVATLWSDGLPEYEVDQGVRVYRLRGTIHRATKLLFVAPGGRVYAPPLPDPELVAALRGLLRRFQPNVVHAHNWMVHSFLPLKTWSGARLIVTLHDYGLVCANWTLMRHGQPCSGPGLAKCLDCAVDTYGPKGAPTVVGAWIMGKVERALVDMFVPVSRAVAVGVGLVDGPWPYRVIPNFISDSPPAPPSDVRAYTEHLPDEPYLLFVGALARTKGVHVLLDAYARLRGAPQALDLPPLVLIGYDASGYKLEPAHLSPHVTVLRNWPHAAVMQAWARSMVGLVPSVWPEPCPTVAMEAMLCGRAVIASRIGGLTDLVTDDETGVLVPPDDPAALRGAIASLVADGPRRERLGRGGRRKVAAFLVDVIVSRIEEVYGAPLTRPMKGRLSVSREGRS